MPSTFAKKAMADRCPPRGTGSPAIASAEALAKVEASQRRRIPVNHQPSSRRTGLDQLFLPVFICVYPRPSAVEMHRSGLVKLLAHIQHELLSWFFEFFAPFAVKLPPSFFRVFRVFRG
jgi:hypothetical protein